MPDTILGTEHTQTNNTSSLPLVVYRLLGEMDQN